MKNLPRQISPLAWALVVRMIAISSLFALILTCGQLYFSYEKDLGYMEKDVELIEKGHLHSISRSVWNLDTKDVEANLMGVSTIATVEYVEARSKNFGVLGRIGEKIENSNLRVFPLSLKTSTGVVNDVGELHVYLDTQFAINNFWTQLFGVLSFNFIKTIVVTFFMLLFVYYLYTRHIEKISEHMANLEKNTLDVPLRLDRRNKQEDEISSLVAAIETMKLELRQSTFQLEQQLEENVKMKAEMLSVAHELGVAETSSEIFHNINNILTPMGFSSFKLKNLLKAWGEADGDGRKEELEDISSRLEKSLSLITNLIVAQQEQASRKEQSKLFSMKQFVIDVTDMLGQQIKDASVRVEIDIEEDLMVYCVHFKFYHILINLIKNAIEALNEVEKGERLICFQGGKLPDFVILKIIDTGMGMDEETLSKLFSRGYTKKVEGHGFGLSSCRNIMKEMNGTIEGHSDGIGRGASFILSLPKGGQEYRKEEPQELSAPEENLI